MTAHLHTIADFEASYTGLIQPDLLENGQVCVDMGEPILEADRIPTTLPASQVSSKHYTSH